MYKKYYDLTEHQKEMIRKVFIEEELSIEQVVNLFHQWGGRKRILDALKPILEKQENDSQQNPE
jgi:DNA-binding PadR family transcriptional regulator